ncbi:MAG TPA: nickel pincer cofactor biosynthesis protein LarB [Dissulfurispiraceae bacterium]|nr:nickel pincer cofactor biosynthesis protein LarB [Dissulfurispiraceae bacterium]
MDNHRLQALLQEVRSGTLNIADALSHLKSLPFEAIPGANIDHHRELRTSVPEVIFAPNKQPEDVVRIARAMAQKSGRFLITKTDEKTWELLGMKGAEYHSASRVISFGASKRKRGLVVIVSAGTSDIPVAEEAAVTASFLGSTTETFYDIGVAGIHRLFSHLPSIEKANAVIAVAGMEGALPSVLGGLTSKPVIAVPTSVGYGVSLGGLTALFAMLHSCVPGVAVVNIDNGFGAGCFAHKINLLASRKTKNGTR